jgi:hypothetical protein
VIAVDEFMKDNVPLRIVCQVGMPDELAEVGPVIVDIAGHPYFTFFRKGNNLRLPERAEPIFIPGRTECLDDLI